MEVLKYKHSYYLDSVHMYGKVIADVYCVPNYTKEGEHFVIKIESKLLMSMINTLPVVTKADHNGSKTYDVSTVVVNKQWIDDCYAIFVKETEITQANLSLLNLKPTVKSMFDLFDDIMVSSNELLKQNNRANALDVLLDCIEKFGNNPNISISMYNVSRCYSTQGNIEKAYEWLIKAQQHGYNDWSHTIVDKDFEQIKNNTDFVEIVKTMMKKNCAMLYGCREVNAYMIVHNLDQLYNRLALEKEKDEKYDCEH